MSFTVNMGNGGEWVSWREADQRTLKLVHVKDEKLKFSGVPRAFIYPKVGTNAALIRR
jgi:hypothetical protein